jgi:hypothetical protein
MYHTRFWLENLKERESWEDPVIDGSIILKRIINELQRCGLDSFASEQENV